MFLGAPILVVAGILLLGGIGPALAQETSSNHQSAAQAPAQLPAPAPADKKDSAAPAPAPKPKKVWTNDDLNELRGDEPVSVVGAQTKNTGRSYSPPPGQTDFAVKMLRQQIDQVQSQIDAVDKQISEIRRSLNGKGSDSERKYDPWGGVPGDLNAQVDQLRARRSSLVKQQDSIEEQLRKLNR
jgi:outer membrane murein-binding lipoprotein Lpp